MRISGGADLEPPEIIFALAKVRQPLLGAPCGHDLGLGVFNLRLQFAPHGFRDSGRAEIDAAGHAAIRFEEFRGGRDIHFVRPRAVPALLNVGGDGWIDIIIAVLLHRIPPLFVVEREQS